MIGTTWLKTKNDNSGTVSRTADVQECIHCQLPCSWRVHSSVTDLLKLDLVWDDVIVGCGGSEGDGIWDGEDSDGSA